jgi:hypothetical protein
MSIEIVTVVNDFEQYKKLISDNEYLLGFKKIPFDNTINNISITSRYNSYIDNLMPDNSWIIFCHQDFEFKEELLPKFMHLDPSFIYGPIGATSKSRISIYFHLFEINTLKNIRIGKSKRRHSIGEIVEQKDGKFIKIGRRIHEPIFADTVDCCCLIVHSSLIKKYNLRFDEQLDWHSYSEDFSLNAKVNHNILTKVVQIEAIHYSKGSFNGGLKDSLAYLREKYQNMPFASTCFDGYYYNFINRL